MTGIDVLFPTPQRCRCGYETQVFHNIEGRTACAGCEVKKDKDERDATKIWHQRVATGGL